MVWLRTWGRDKGRVPPGWLRIEIDDGVEMVEENRLRKGISRDALAKAHELLARERRVARKETDESGRK